MEKHARRIAKNARELDAIIALYKSSDEAKGLEARSTDDLIEMYEGDRDWLRTPCGDMSIDGGIHTRCVMVSDILRGRNVRFIGGQFRI